MFLSLIAGYNILQENAAQQPANTNEPVIPGKKNKQIN